MDYVIQCEEGLHARPASELAELAQTFSCDIRIINKENNMEADAKSIIEILCLGAAKGTRVDIVAVGAGADNAVEDIVTLLDSIVH